MIVSIGNQNIGNSKARKWCRLTVRTSSLIHGTQWRMAKLWNGMKKNRKEITMIITDFNQMSGIELTVINKTIGLSFVIEDGKITKVVNDKACNN
nr:MAG TPA: hypothetical protein [Caudoviricetes sp.]